MKIKRGKPQQIKSLEYAILLKRKRIEQGRTLKEVSRGVCTASYLSRIENQLVRVDDDYYKCLFKKLNVNFNEIKETRNMELFFDIARFQLLYDIDKVKTIIEEAFENTYYSETEYLLIMFYSNIIENHFKDLNNILYKLEEESRLTDEEVFFFKYCKALYNFKTGKFLLAYKELNDLPVATYEHFNYLKDDLMMDIAVRLGDYKLFNKYYYLIYNDTFLTAFNACAIKHKAQVYYFEYDFDEVGMLDEIDLISDHLPEEVKKEIDWLILASYYQESDLDELLNEIDDCQISYRNVALVGAIAVKNNHARLWDIFLSQYNVLNRNDDYYEKICELWLCLYNKQNLTEGYLKAKEIIMLKKQGYYDAFFINIIKKYIIELGITLGKYKDTLNILYHGIE